MTVGDNQLVFRAKALAQTHALTVPAKRLLDAAAEHERESQPMPEVGIWASSAALTGYCVRRVEEDEAGLRLEAVDADQVDLDALDATATRVVADLRSVPGAGGPEGPAASHFLGDEERIVGALDHIIRGEIDRRLNNWGAQVDRSTFTEVGDYLSFWVVKGYALRVAEAETGALVPAPADAETPS